MMQDCTVVCANTAPIASGNPPLSRRQAFEPVDNRDQDVIDAPGLELVLQFEQELGALSVLDPQPEHLLLARAVESERDIDGPVMHQALVPKLDPQGEENYIGAQRVGKDLAQPELELALPVRGSAIVSR